MRLYYNKPIKEQSLITLRKGDSMSLTRYTEAAQTQLFKDLGVFFAFSQAQYDEQAKKDVEYASCGAGMICPVCHLGALKEGLGNITEKGVKQDLADNGRENIIKRELANFECEFSGDITDVTAALSGYGITYEEIKSVYEHATLPSTED